MTVLKFRNPNTRFDILGDWLQFDLIVQDMSKNGGKLVPSDHWNWNLNRTVNDLCNYSIDLFNEKYSHLSKMLDPWVGVTGMKVLGEESVEKWEPFLRPIDHMQLLPTDILTQGSLNAWRETDLGSVLDLSLISTFFANPLKERLKICEVGGGYGRLTEVFLETYKNRVHYVMIDAVPGSLMYSYYYLKSQFPELSIGSFYAGDDYNSDYDCYILPAWHTRVLQESSFDICVNIESMQEMEQHHVDFYLNLFDRLTVSKGVVYLSNARDYVFKGIWNIPTHWETLYLNNTPRSWSPDHPTHILRKNEGDFSKERDVHENAFRQQVIGWNNSKLILEQKILIAHDNQIQEELQNKLIQKDQIQEELQNKLIQKDQICENLQNTIDLMRRGFFNSKLKPLLKKMISSNP